jgi:hypothetical protein
MNCLTCGSLLDWNTTPYGTEYETCLCAGVEDLTWAEADEFDDMEAV